jgi:hypothetical protein
MLMASIRFEFVLCSVWQRGRKEIPAFLLYWNGGSPSAPESHSLPSQKLREHPITNIQHSTANACASCSRWMFDIGCWLLDVPLLRFRDSKREPRHSWNSLPIRWGEGARQGG